MQEKDHVLLFYCAENFDFDFHSQYKVVMHQKFHDLGLYLPKTLLFILLLIEVSMQREF